MEYNVLHFTKLKSSGGGIGAHIDRRHIPNNADPEKVKDNWELIKPHHGLHYDINKRISEGYNHRKKDGSLKKIRHDAVKAVGVIISGSHDQMKEIQRKGELKEWAWSNLEWMEKRFGAANILRFTMHMDEKTPHIHAVFTPIVDGKMCAKEVLGDKKHLSELQDEHAALNAKFGLKRGKKHTRLKHTTTREYYARMSEIEQEAEIQTNMFGKVADGEQQRIKNLVVSQETEVYNAFADALREQKNYLAASREVNEEKAKLSDLKDNLSKKLDKVQKIENVKNILSKTIKKAMYGSDEERKQAIDTFRKLYPPHAHQQSRNRQDNKDLTL